MTSDNLDTCWVIYGVIEDAELEFGICFVQYNDYDVQKTVRIPSKLTIKRDLA